MLGLMSAVLVAIITILLFVSQLFARIPSVRTIYYMLKIPGPPGNVLLGNTLELSALKLDEFLMWIINSSKNYPRMMRVWLLGHPTVYLKDADDLQVILSSNSLITKGFEYNLTKTWLQDGLIHSTGPKWHTRRKILTQSFHFKILEGAVPVFNKHCRRLAETFASSKGEPVKVITETSECTMKVICESAMGIDLNEDDNAAEYKSLLKRASEYSIKRLFKPWLMNDWIYYLTAEGKQHKKDVAGLHGFTNKVIKERQEKYLKSRNELGNGCDLKKDKIAFLDTLLEIEARNPGTFFQSDVREEVNAFMFAGHDTTGTFLDIYFSLIGTYDDIQNRVYEELQSIFGDDMDRDIELRDLAKMKYMDCTIKETMRILPAVPYISRYLTEDLNLDGGVKIPAGASVVISPILVHHNTKYWKNPEKYDPERFLQENDRHSFSFIPFSAGPRNCIGQKFAMYEIKIAIAYVLRKLRVVAITRHGDFNPGLKVIFFPTKEIFCSFHER